jgi:hypothetical protein
VEKIKKLHDIVSNKEKCTSTKERNAKNVKRSLKKENTVQNVILLSLL